MGDRIVHLRNGHADRPAHTMGVGVTWCGKKLLGKPETSHGTVDTFLCYGSEVRVTFDPTQGSCARCAEAFNSAYEAAFPDGLKPVATFRLDDPTDVERARALFSPEALARTFGPGGGGMAEFRERLEGAA
ncbi:hypothetical protein [Sphingomonas sp.]|uniref:hypothetical protein n=1 Tax=Sphingomonas sp. TaxID=28214 RepID=UPI00307D61BD